ncbi:chemotaxis protein CheA [Vibrio sinaloensis DSM 21326]|uniref:Chemotaxis protein CheA n=1 Tax=Vibrio sinaloensis DSM 21326 TaxID=945550 RepID=E8M6G8_PHOS4|nr:chemotaxis protein CheA [Vibrio sinaloensis]EGA70286.1 chemotaxis protein CheA [Vibrio sinaloensis DSM 21326]
MADFEKAVATFFNESSELVEEVELVLLDKHMMQNQFSEWIEILFRAVHTIKGSAGLFGFDSIVDLSHCIESILDKLRQHKLTCDEELVELLLESNDVLRQQIEAMNVQQAAPYTQPIMARLSPFIDDEIEPKARPEVENNPFASPIDEGVWHISFRPHRHVFQDGLDPASFIHFLAGKGELEDVRVVTEQLEVVSKEGRFSPEDCYLGFEIRFRGALSREQILDAFEFILNDADIVLIPPESQVERYIELIDRLPEENQKIGQILVDIGAISERELQAGLNAQQQLLKNQQHAPLLGQVLTETQQLPSEVINAAVSKQQPKLRAAKTLRVEADKLDQLIDLVGEMVITGARTNLLAHETGDESLIEAMAQLERLVESIRDSSLQLRMVQIGDTFNKFKRIVRDTASALNKQVDLVVSGAETELDKTFVEKLSDPLTHLVRNAIDHGIEETSERIALGKQSTGIVRLNAYHDSGSIVIEVIDDGQGIDEEKILKIGREKGLVHNGDKLTKREIWQLIFEPGFSTNDEVTDLSGRGVGMDVVKRNIELLRGSIELDSQPGVGSRFVIRLPLTLSIVDGFMFKVAGGDYVIPLDNVVECLELNEVMDKQQAGHKKFVNLRDEVLPFLRLSEWFGVPAHSSFEQEALVVVQLGSFRAGLVVDSLSGEFQTVVKSLGPLYEGLRGVSGATILGSGEVAIILDIFALIQTALSQNERVNVGRFSH